MSKNTALGFFVGGVIGAAVGAVAGLLLAPRSGAETRAMAADAMNDAWDSAVDTYEQGARTVTEYIGNLRPQVDAATDELRAKVDAARERMAQVRSSLSDTVTTSSAPVSDAVRSAVDQASGPVVAEVVEDEPEV